MAGALSLLSVPGTCFCLQRVYARTKAMNGEASEEKNKWCRIGVERKT